MKYIFCNIGKTGKTVLGHNHSMGITPRTLNILRSALTAGPAASSTATELQNIAARSICLYAHGPDQRTSCIYIHTVLVVLNRDVHLDL